MWRSQFTVREPTTSWLYAVKGDGHDTPGEAITLPTANAQDCVSQYVPVSSAGPTCDWSDVVACNPATAETTVAPAGLLDSRDVGQPVSYDPQKGTVTVGSGSRRRVLRVQWDSSNRPVRGRTYVLADVDRDYAILGKLDDTGRVRVTGPVFRNPNGQQEVCVVTQYGWGQSSAPCSCKEGAVRGVAGCIPPPPQRCVPPTLPAWDPAETPTGTLQDLTLVGDRLVLETRGADVRHRINVVGDDDDEDVDQRTIEVDGTGQVEVEDARLGTAAGILITSIQGTVSESTILRRRTQPTTPASTPKPTAMPKSTAYPKNNSNYLRRN